MDVYEGIMSGLEDALAYERGEPNECSAHIVSDEVPRYKKKSQAKPPPKAKHKHYYEPCVFEFNGCRISQEHGVTYDKPSAAIRAYCPVCGKVGSLPDRERWYATRYISHPVFTRVIEPYETDECKRELNPETRTLPTFRVEDEWFTKYVDISKV